MSNDEDEDDNLTNDIFSRSFRDRSTCLPEPIYLPPPLFSKINHPQEYNFEENPLAKGLTGENGNVVKRGWIPV